MLDLARIQGVILDMDGVVWRGAETLPGVPVLFDFLAARQIRYVFATNNSTQTPDAYSQRLNRLGVQANQGQIVTSSTVTAHYLRQQYPDFSTVFIVGQEGLRQALLAQGFREIEGQAELVVVGLDRQLTYDKLRTAAFQIRRGAVFVGTNGDKSIPDAEGIAPGAGSILAALEAATGQAPVVTGKPEAPMFEQALAILGTVPATTLMVGDRLDTDIWGAKRSGLQSALILSGVVGEAELTTSDLQPDAAFADLAHLMMEWQQM
jgi:4-nitrophenyl phosphatase